MTRRAETHGSQLPLLVTDAQSARAAEFWRMQREIERVYRELIARKERG